MPHDGNQEWSTLGQAGRDFYRVSRTVVDMVRSGQVPKPCSVPAEPQNIVIDLNRTAIIIVDMQYEFCDPKGWLGSLGADVGPARELITPINRTVSALRDAGVPVIWLNWGVRPDRRNLSPGTQKTFNPDGVTAGLGDLKSQPISDDDRILQAGSPGAAVISDLDQRPEDIRVDKHRLSGFWDTPLDSILRNGNIRTILFAGINADECVYATLMDANFHGYDTVMIEDAVATTSPSYCLDATIYNVRFCLGFTIKSHDLINSLEK